MQVQDEASFSFVKCTWRTPIFSGFPEHYSVKDKFAQTTQAALYCTSGATFGGGGEGSSDVHCCREKVMSKVDFKLFLGIWEVVCLLFDLLF